MTIISMFLVGILISLELQGLKSAIKPSEKVVDEETKQNFKLIGYIASCLSFAIYFVCLIIPAFTIGNKYTVLSIVLVLLTELVATFRGISQVSDSKDYDDMRERFVKGHRKFMSVFVEICELIIFISIFVQLFQQL